MMLCHGANPIFFNKKKKRIGRPEHSLTPHPDTSDNISFLSTPTLPPSPQSGPHMCITPYVYHTISVRQQRFNQSSRPLKKNEVPQYGQSFQTQSFQNKSLALRKWNGFRIKSKYQIFIAYHSPMCLIIESI